MERQAFEKGDVSMIATLRVSVQCLSIVLGFS